MRKEVDTSDFTIEEVLSIECKDKRWRLMAYLSKYLNKTQRNYKIHDKKILVVIKGLENWKNLIKGAKFKFRV